MITEAPCRAFSVFLLEVAMTISYNWLKEYISIEETPEELGHLLTSTGLEVERVELHETIKGGLEGLVIGEVLTCLKHPNADKLSLTTVDGGNGNIYPVVCGASNVAAGQKIILALPGATLYPTKGEPFTIKEAKIRGEVSRGMICAEDEIGLGDSHAGIIVLTTSLPNGTPAAHYYNLQKDYILEIGLTPNRADAASHLGVARDIKAARNRSIQWPSVEGFKIDRNEKAIQVEVKSPAAIRYSGLYLTGIKVTESPDWLKQRLAAIGVTAINNVVDITNYVLHETGQPLHAFDAAKITGKKIVVETLAEGTPFVTLDGKERKLGAADLMICDGNHQPMCIGGVFGGLHSGISNATTEIFLESACFAPDSIRKSGQLHQLKTDASFRFERGTDPNLTVYALKRAALLLKELANAEIASDIIDIYSAPVPFRKIQVWYKHINRLIGKEIPPAEIIQILELLDIQIENRNDAGFLALVPPFRVDVFGEADIAEEVLRIYGLNRLELQEHAGTPFISSFPEKDPDSFRKEIGSLLIGAGFFEIWTNSLTTQRYQERHQLEFEGKPVEILNKLSEEQGILRQTLLFTGLEVCAYNINRRQKDLKLYEFGKTYAQNPGYQETEWLALYVTGLSEPEGWQTKQQPVSYFHLAQQVHHVLLKSGIQQPEAKTFQNGIFEYGQELWYAGERLGRIGKVRTALVKEFGIRQEIFFAELNAHLLFKASSPKLVIREVSKFPEVRRDLSVVIDKSVTFEEIHKVILATGKRLIKDIVAFDIYEGDKIPAGKKAYALGFTLLDEQKTLTDQEIEKTMEHLITVLEKNLGAVIRK